MSEVGIRAELMTLRLMSSITIIKTEANYFL